MGDLTEESLISRSETLAAIENPELQRAIEAGTQDAINQYLWGAHFLLFEGEPFWGEFVSTISTYGSKAEVGSNTLSISFSFCPLIRYRRCARRSVDISSVTIGSGRSICTAIRSLTTISENNRERLN